MKVLLILLGLAGSAWWALDLGNGSHAWDRSDAQVSYYGNGQRRSLRTYVDGQPHGDAEEWHPDGTPAARGRYEHGLRAGEWSFWLEGGALDHERSGLYVEGRRVGPAGDRLAREG